MGNYVLQKYIEKGYSVKSKYKLFNNIILNSSAVKQKDHAAWVEQLKYQKNTLTALAGNLRKANT